MSEDRVFMNFDLTELQQNLKPQKKIYDMLNITEKL